MHTEIFPGGPHVHSCGLHRSGGVPFPFLAQICGGSSGPPLEGCGASLVFLMRVFLHQIGPWLRRIQSPLSLLCFVIFCYPAAVFFTNHHVRFSLFTRSFVSVLRSGYQPSILIVPPSFPVPSFPPFRRCTVPPFVPSPFVLPHLSLFSFPGTSSHPRTGSVRSRNFGPRWNQRPGVDRVVAVHCVVATAI